jgi:hypothetical protein
MAMTVDGFPTFAVDHGEFFWLSGGLGLDAVTDFSSGVAVRKKDGEIFSWHQVSER